MLALFMPTYRVYYAERAPATDDQELFPHIRLAKLGQHRQQPYEETEWEEEVAAESMPEALDSFFRSHVKDNSELMWLDDDGRGQPIQGLDFDPDAAYIWVEGDKLMEYQGIDEATAGKVSCPLCGGAGEVDEAIADEYLADFTEEAEDEITFG